MVKFSDFVYSPRRPRAILYRVIIALTRQTAEITSSFQRPPSDVERICESCQGYRSNFGFRVPFHCQIWDQNPFLDRRKGTHPKIIWIWFFISYALMCECWQTDPDRRPRFESISSTIKRLQRCHKVWTNERTLYWFHRENLCWRHCLHFASLAHLFKERNLVSSPKVLVRLRCKAICQNTSQKSNIFVFHLVSGNYLHECLWR